MNRFLSLATSLLALLVLAIPARSQMAFGPVPVEARPESSELAPLSYDFAGNADVLWAERFAGRGMLPERPSVVVRLVLQDGRSWEADVAAAASTVLDEGKLSQTTMHWAQLLRQGSPALLGVHLAIERRADQVVLLSLAISNAAIDPLAPQTFPGSIYYRRIEVDVGYGQVIPECIRAGERMVGRRYVITDKPGYFPARSHFNRRMAVVPNARTAGARDWSIRARNALDLVGLDLPATYAHFGASKLTLPGIDRAKVEQAASARLARVRAVLAAGNPDPPTGLRSGSLGPFTPAGWDVAGGVGGEGIELLPGWDATRSGALLRRTLHDLEMERHPVAFYDARTGAPLARLPSPQDYRLTRGLGKVTSLVWTTIPFAPTNPYDDRRVLRDWNTGACAYRLTLLAYQPHDGQHLVRATHNGEAAWWLARDWLARLDLEMIAADARYAWTLYPVAASPGYVPPGLSVVLNAARAKPGLGTPALGREFGWVANAWSIDLAAASALTPRSEKLVHGRAALECVGLIAMPTGITQRLSQGSFFGSPDPWTGDGVPADMDVAQWVLEGPIVATGTLGLMRNAVEPSDPLVAKARNVIVKWARSAYLNPNIVPKPTPWNAGVYGIPKWAVVAPKGGAPLGSIAVTRGAADPSNSWHHIALAWELTGEAVFLEAMNKLGGPVSNREQRLASFGRTELTQTASAVSALQRAIAGTH